MRIEGTIASIERDGGYDSQNGYIYTFQMAIQSQQGELWGQIGSKTEVYPLDAGQPIIVERTEDKHGVKFKKINPQFAGQGQQGRPQGQGQKKEKVDWDAIAEGKVRCNIISAAIQSGQIICKTKEDVSKYTDFVMGKGDPPPMQSGPQDFNPPPASDDIPF